MNIKEDEISFEFNGQKKEVFPGKNNIFVDPNE